MTARRLRAAFLGTDARGVIDQLAKNADGDLEVAGGRWIFRPSKPQPLASGEWARGIDLVVLGAVVGAALPHVNSVRAPPRQALLHAAAAGVPRVVIAARSDADELAHRSMCSELGLEGDEATVVRLDQIRDVSELVDAMDRVAVAPPPGAVMGGVVASAADFEVDLFGTMLRGTLERGSRAHVLVGGEWIACTVARITARPGSWPPDDLRVANAGDHVSLFLRTARGVGALVSEMTGRARLTETLVVEEPLPLLSAVDREQALEPFIENPPLEARVFLGWNVTNAHVVDAQLLFDRPQPAPPTGRYFILW